MATIDELKNALKNGGLRQNKYRIIFPRIPGAVIDPKNLSILCKATSLPGSKLNELGVPYMGMTGYFGGEVEFDVWNITVLTDSNTETRDAFEQWVSLIRHYSDSEGEVETSNYQVDVTVEALTRSGKVAKSYTFKNMFPTAIGEVSLAYDSPDIAQFPVTLRYDYHEPKTTNGIAIK